MYNKIENKEEKKEQVLSMHFNTELPVAKIAQECGVSTSTAQRWITLAREKEFGIKEPTIISDEEFKARLVESLKDKNKDLEIEIKDLKAEIDDFKGEINKNTATILKLCQERNYLMNLINYTLTLIDRKALERMVVDNILRNSPGAIENEK